MNVLAFGDRAGNHMYGRGDDWFPAGAILAVLLLGALLAAGVFLATRRRRGASAGPVAPASGFGAAAPYAAPAGADDALNLVRLRYARGEMGRDEYLQTAADLGGAIVPVPPVAAPVVPAPEGSTEG